MKKRIIIFLISLLILNIFVISLIKAELTFPIPNTGGSDSALPPELEKVKGIGENLTDSEIRSQYLKQEWGKILANNKIIGPIIKSYEKIAPVTDPVFKYIIGITPSLTWLFILTLTIWICLTIYIFRFLELFSIVSKPTQYLIFIATMIGISFTKISLKLAEYIIEKLSLFTVWWMQLIGMGIAMGIFILASVFSKQLKEFFKKAKERRAKMKEEANRMELEKNAKVSSILAESAS